MSESKMKRECKFCERVESNNLTLNVWFIHSKNYSVPNWDEYRTTILDTSTIKSFSGPYHLCRECEHRSNELKPKIIKTVEYRLTDEDVFGPKKYLSYLLKKQTPINKIEVVLQKYRGIPNHKELVHYNSTRINTLTKNDLVPILRKLGVREGTRPPTELGDILLLLYRTL